MESVPAQLRRERILDLVRTREFVRVAELSKLFGLSEVTIRSDLDALASSGSLQRVHGGAIVKSPRTPRERPYEEGLDDDPAAKQAIGRAAARMVEPGDTLILDVGTTTAFAARALVARSELVDVTVFTSGIRIALELEPTIPRFHVVVVTGGTLRPLQHSLVDPLAGSIFNTIHATRVFLGCSGVHPTEGITNVNLPEAEMKKKMLRSAQECVVLAEGSKVGNISVAKVAGLDNVDVVVTDTSAPPEVVEELRAAGVDVEVAY